MCKRKRISRYSSPASTGTIRLETECERVRLQISKHAASMLVLFLSHSQQLTVTIQDGRWTLTTSYIQKSLSPQNLQWSQHSKPLHGTDGSVAAKSATPSKQGNVMAALVRTWCKTHRPTVRDRDYTKQTGGTEGYSTGQDHT